MFQCYCTLVSTDVSSGTWRVIRWLIFALLGGRKDVRLLQESMECHQIRTVISFYYCATVFPCTMRWLNFLHTCVSHSSKVVRF